jgi:hypothetical protein
MSEQHTPGPWEWDTNPVEYDPEQEAPWLVTCEHAKIPDAPILQGQIKCSSEANARLIAAAPELLSAAQQALDECADLIETPAGSALVAAIRKATEQA